MIPSFCRGCCGWPATKRMQDHTAVKVALASLTNRSKRHTLRVMSKLQPARAATTEAFLAEAGPELAALCTACGACFEACPMPDHIGVRSKDAKSITDGLSRLAR